MDKLYNITAFKTSEVITKTYSTSFSIAVSILSKEWRMAVYSIYGFVRYADEIVDTFHDTDQEKLLNDLERDLWVAHEKGISLNPVLHAFALTIRKYDISKELVTAFMDSMRADLVKNEYADSVETQNYIYGSAEVVGLMCLQIFVDGDKGRYQELEHPARMLGSAFQKVNFLRDLKQDFQQLDRTYFSGFSPERFTEEYKQKLVQEIEGEFSEALKGISMLPGRSRFAVYVAYLYYQRLLNKLKRTPAKKIIHSRIRVRNRYKILLLAKAAFDYKLRLISAA